MPKNRRKKKAPLKEQREKEKARSAASSAKRKRDQAVQAAARDIHSVAAAISEMTHKYNIRPQVVAAYALRLVTRHEVKIEFGPPVNPSGLVAADGETPIASEKVDAHPKA